MPTTVDEVIARRLRVQRLTSAPLSDPADVVRLLLCAQAQDPPLARYSIGMRCADGTDGTVRSAINDGRLLRTHILRPTWHFVTREDLRWLLALTSRKVESSLAGRHRQLDLDTAAVDRAHDAFAQLLVGRRHLTRRAIAVEIAEADRTYTNEQLGHLLLLAELRGLVCSGPMQGDVHTYGLVDELVAQSPPVDRDDAMRELVARFFAGHGPAAITDLTRWVKVTQTETKHALAELGDRLETVTVDGIQLWFDPSLDRPEDRPRRAFLIPVFDEAYLTYPKLNLRRVRDHPSGDVPHLFSQAGSGLIACDRHDVGWFKRTKKGKQFAVTLAVAPSLTRRQRDLIDAEVDRMDMYFASDV